LRDQPARESAADFAEGSWMKTLSLAGVVLAAAVLSGSALAQEDLTHDPELVQAGHYGVEPRHTRVLFSVLHFGYTHYYGDFTGASGTLDLDPKHVDAAQVRVSIPTASVSTTNAQLDGELKGASWFNSAKYPTMTFVSRHVTRTGAKTAQIEGDLTLNGATHPITLDVSFNAAGLNPLDRHYTIGFDAAGKLKRSDFGVKAFVPLVSDEVDIIVSAAFERQS
jgi:polyisoprenoid-binding protein YceI